MNNYEIASLCITSLSALFVGLSLIYLSKQIKLVISAHADNHEWNRRIETQNALDRIREVDTSPLNERFQNANRKEPISLQEILGAFESDLSLQLILHKLLNYYEGLANGYYLGTYDEASIKANRRGPMEKELVLFKNYIEYRRRQSNPRAWIDYERLINKWHQETLGDNDREQTGSI